LGQVTRERPLVIWIGGGRQGVVADLIKVFEEGLREVGYRDGYNIEIAYLFAEGQVERVPALADEVVRRNPTVILAGAVDTALAVKARTTSIPIVSPALADATHLGLVKSFARPGGNVTGITPYVEGLPEKQMELARDLVPKARKIGLIGNMNDAKAPPQRDELSEAGRKLGIEIVAPDIRTPEDIARAMQDLADAQVDVVIVLQTTMLLSERRPIAVAAAAKRLPTICGYRQHVADGGLVSYGVDLLWCFRRAATFIDKILKGAAPQDIPVEFPSRLQMVVNLGTAKALGITIPPTVLARADEVIE